MKADNLKKLDWATTETLSGDWNKTYKIDQNAPFEFKMIDNHLIMKHIKKSIKNNKNFQEQHSKNLEFMNTLSDIKIWLKLDDSVIPMSLLDVYHTFTKNLKDSSFEDQLYNCNEVSFVGPTGPFKELPLVQCLNDRLVDKFLFESSLKSKIPARNTRVRTQGDILVTHGEKLELQNRIQIRQITNNGILFSSKDGMAIDTFSRSEILKFHINTESIKEFTDNNFKATQDLNKNFFYSEDDLKYFYIEESKIKKSLSYKSDETNEFFLFIRYCDMLESEVPTIFCDFTKKLEDYFQYSLREN